MLTEAQRLTLTRRNDLLAREAELVRDQRITWRGRLAQMGDYGSFGGGSATDRRLIVEAMAALEAGPTSGKETR